ncbi:MAG: hypothetical protein IJU21_02275 [Bacteroidales bacterium]|nr:hypothetical protein [Bacteroidales bacterium]
MKQSKLKAGILLSAASALLLGLGSCNKEPSIDPAAKVVIPFARVQATVGDPAGATKASLNDARTLLSWEVGDKLVMVSNGLINGTLTCTSLDGTVGNFEGDMSKFNLDVTLYFLGNQSANAVDATFDLSRQSGTADGLVNFLFLKTAVGSVHLKDVTPQDASEGEKKFVLDGSVTFNPQPILPFFELRDMHTALIKAGYSDGTDLDGVKTTSVTFHGLQNQLNINLLTGESSSSMAPDKNYVTVSPITAQRSNSYIMAIAPQVASKVSVEINYTGFPAANSIMMTGANWNMSDASKGYFLDWTKDQYDSSNPNSVSYGSLVFKGGYYAGTVGGGERADGLNIKQGYGGQNPDGTSDDPQGNKQGYNGHEPF